MDANNIFDKVDKKLESIKEDLYNLTSSPADDDVLIKIVKLDEVDDKVYEAIIILYSKFRAEAQMLRSDTYKNSARTIDSLIEINNGCSYLAEAIQAAKEAKQKRGGTFTKLTYLFGIVFSVSFLATVIFSLFKQDHAAAQLVIDFFKTINLPF